MPKYTPCDIEKWGKAELWDAMDAAQILVNIEPLPMVDGVMYPIAAGKVLDRLTKALQRRELQAIKFDGENPPQLMPIQYIEWAEKNALALPPGLKDAVLSAVKRDFKHFKTMRDLVQGQRVATSQPRPVVIKTARLQPTAGDNLTPLVWRVCYEIHEAGETVRPQSVMARLKRLAESTGPERGCLVGVTSDGVKWELLDALDANSMYRELRRDALAARIREWRAATGIAA